MIGEPIRYRKGYKYILDEDWGIDLNLFKPFPILPADVVTEYVRLSKDGQIWVRHAYAWDGCSGPTIDTKTNMRPGLLHDGGYQLVRLGLIPQEYKSYFDDLLKIVGMSDGMWEFRASYYRAGVMYFSGDAAKPGYEPYPVLEAP